MLPMAVSQRLRLRDVRAAGEWVAEVAQCGADPTAWRTQALVGLARLVDGQLGLTLDCTGALPGGHPRPIDPLDVGWSGAAERQMYADYYRTQVVDDPGTRALLNGHVATRFITATREQLIDDATWYAAPAVSDLRRLGGVDDFVSSTVALRPGVLHGFVVYRPWGERRRFTPRERRLVRLCHLWLFQLYRRGLADGAATAAVAALPPRARQALDLLLAGRSTKQVAAGLGISRHTVNDYTKLLHHHFGVTTRAELLAKCLPRERPLPLAVPAGLLTPA